MLAQRVKENQLPRTAAPSQREYFTSTGPPSMGTKPGLIVAVTAAAALGASSPQDGDESLESWTGKPAFSGLCFFTERAETRSLPLPNPMHPDSHQEHSRRTHCKCSSSSPARPGMERSADGEGPGEFSTIKCLDLTVLPLPCLHFLARLLCRGCG